CALDDGGQPAVGYADLGPDPVAVGMPQLVQRAQRLRPRPAGRARVARAVVDVAETIERARLVVPVGELAAQVQGPLVAGDGAVIVAELVVDIAEAVPGGGLPVAFPGGPAAGQRLPAVGDGLPVVPEPRVAVADVVHAHDLQGLVPGGPGQLERPDGVTEHVAVALLLLGDPDQAAVPGHL